jgi:Pvc16 N-terminal domain
VLVDLLNNGLIDHDVGSTVGGRVTVSALPPDRVLPANGNETTQLNLFLHHVTPNMGWRNAGQPAVNSRGERVGNPPLALDLHYLLSAYGAKDFYAEILLGFGMQLIHEHPVLSREEIAAALASPTPTTPTTLPESLQDISKSELADQVELIKITPEPLSTEEISKIWTAFQTHYRATAAYSVSVVLIESKVSTRRALRVRSHNVYAKTLRRPSISSVVSSIADDAPILADATIVIRGARLAGDVTLVRIAGTPVTPDPADVTDAEIRLALAGLDLRAGAQPIQVVHQVPMGTPEQPHRAVESNLAAFVLAPTITTAVTKTLTTVDGVSTGTLSFDVAPELQAGQHAALFLNQLLDPGAPDDAVAVGYSFPSAPLTADTGTASFQVEGIVDGTYLVRIQVDGAESPLHVDQVTGRFDDPTVVIP